MNEFVNQENERIKSQLLWRNLSIMENARAHEVIIDGKKYINFSSNDYLGFSHDPKIVQAGIEALNKYGSGGRSSRLISGTLDLHAELEKRLAEFKSTEASILFPTGFMANLGVISALLGAGDAIIIDRLDHASLLDATKLAKCRVFVYEHCSVKSLQKVLERTKSYKKRLVATDSLFSMDGDFAPLADMVELCKQHKVWLMIDDAHATGIFGKNGTGMAEVFNLLGKIEIIMGTLSKAMGSQGGFVCGSKDFIDFLINKARPFIFTTALSPVSCAAAMTALTLIQEEPARRDHLLALSKKLREHLKEKFSSHIDASAPNSQIVPFRVGSASKAIALAEHLKDYSIYAPAIRPPTVPKDECRIRFSLTSEHTEKDTNQLIKALSRFYQV